MRFDIVTIFPESFDSFLSSSLIGKAIESGLIEVNFVDPRDHTTDRHRSVDDTPYGGGEGMVLKPEPLVAALESIEARLPEDAAKPHRVLLSPQGKVLEQEDLHRLQAKGHVVMTCGRYEGFDDRIRTFVHEELSLGDFVLNGGEVAAMSVIEGVARLVPGVIGKPESLTNESHAAGLLEHPHYTRPREFRGLEVPQVLLSGDHRRIEQWRREQMLRRTRSRRPDLWERFEPSPTDYDLLAEPAGSDQLEPTRTYIALLHHPVYDRSRRVITTAITNLDLHDIARSSRTYGLAGYFVVTPLSSQQELAKRIMSHWTEGHGATFNPSRREALSLISVADGLAEVVKQIEEREGIAPCTIATSAAEHPRQLSKRKIVASVGGRPALLLVGTGWGLAQEVMDTADFSLFPVKGRGKYNHLSVRSAVAIILDRFFGMRE